MQKRGNITEDTPHPGHPNVKVADWSKRSHDEKAQQLAQLEDYVVNRLSDAVAKTAADIKK